MLPERVVLPNNEAIRLEFAVPANADYSMVLDSVFTADLADLIPHMPTQWQNYATKNLAHNGAHATPATEQPKSEPSTRRIGGAIEPPRMLSGREPEFNNSARGVKLNGTCLVYLQVGEDAKVSHVAIVRPIGLGLDESALVAVQAYKFAPAMENGKPVAVELNVEVKFEIY
jgi:TonB family protein